jgi:thiosulfate/3-mercaptopyruvate sulfurtransferase
MGTPWPRPLIETAELAARLGDPALRLIECSVVLAPLPDWSDFRAESGRALYEAGHLPGAVYADPLADLADPRSPYRFTMPPPARLAAALGRLGVGPGTFAVLYCRGQNTMAARVWWMLRAVGWDDAAVLDGGWAKWNAEGRPVSRETRAYPPAAFPLRPRPGLFVGKAEVRAALGDPGTAIVNALAREQHEGRGGVTYGRPGRIPGSRCVPARALTDPATHAYLPVDRLRAAFAEAGALDRRVVTYCGAGVAASSDALVLTLLGVPDVAVYDGSLEEWARDPEMPMERD